MYSAVDLRDIIAPSILLSALQYCPADKIFCK